MLAQTGGNHRRRPNLNLTLKRIALVTRLVLALALAGTGRADDLLQMLPPGVFLQKRGELPADQREAIGRKLGGGIRAMTNSLLQVQGRMIQANIISAESDASANAIYETLSRVKGAPFCVRKDQTIVEYVGNDIDVALATKTSYELKLVPKPDRLRYRVTATVAAIDRVDYSACNPLFNQFLALRGGDDPQILARIGALAKRFQFGRTLVLRNPKLGEANAVYQLEPAPSGEETAGGVVRYAFAELPVRHGVPYVKGNFDVSTDATGFSASAAPPDPRLTATTAYWPADDSKMTALAKEIAGDKTTNDAKAAAILTWLTPGRNLRFEGETGSRWGTLKVFEQKFGQCWDFSDCFVTLCRAAGVPSRQVAGWLYGSSGHVWAEYYREGRGWQQVDPTSGGRLTCGIYHIAYFTSEDGEMPIVYLSMPKIEIKEQDR